MAFKMKVWREAKKNLGMIDILIMNIKFIYDLYVLLQ